MAVIAPEASGAGTDMIYMSVPIEKREDTAEINPVDNTPDLKIWGKVTDGTLDSDLQIVDPEASLRWIKTWYDTKANIRMGHDPRRPVGRGLEIDGHYVKALIADPTAKHLIRTKVLNDWSIGIMHPDVIPPRDPRFRQLDPTGKAVQGVITDRPDGLTGLGEISVVDRGANYGSAFQLVKAAADGSPEWTGTWTSESDDKPCVEHTPKTLGLTNIDLPSDMKLKVTPTILAKMATLKRDLVLQEQAAKAAGEAFIAKAAEPDAAKGVLRDSERAGMPAGDFAYVDSQGGKHLPVHDEGHVRSALGRFAQQHFESAGAKRKAAKKIVSRARGMGIDLGEHGTVVAAAGKTAAPAISKDDDKLGQCPSCKGRGFVKKPGNMKCEACGGSGRATAKSVVPDAVKCMKCDGSQMFEGKPCPDCKDGEKAVAPGAEKKKGKMRALCPNCGAKQNPEHKHCPECGKPLPPNAVQVTKNHNFVCLGCGKDLDKGEPHCPECGKDNPGYLPEADRKIPANEDADKSAGKDRVAKGKKSGKKGGKKMPFGGNQAKPFGSEEKEPEDKPKAEKRRKGKGKRYGTDPAAGVTGHETMGLPPHREPDGAPVEQFENDAHLEDGDQQMKAALRHKSFSAVLTPDEAVLHDLTCPAFSPKSVEACLPHASFAAIDTGYWSQKALDATAEGDITTAMARWNAAQALSQAAVTLKTADPEAMHRLRVAGHQAFLQANKDVIKTFTDATPGPGSAPTPAGYLHPGQYRRPYISAGHAAASPQYEPARNFPVITDHPQAQDYQRGYLSAGHATESPDNMHGHAPMPEGNAGAPESRAQGAAQMQARDYESAVSTMHDHLSRIAPGICPMSPEMGRTQKPAPHVPEAVGAPEPHGAKASKAERAAQKAKAAAKAARVAKRKAAAQKRRIESQVLKGKLTPEEGRAKLGMTAKAATTQTDYGLTALPLAEAMAVGPAPITPDEVAAAVKAAVTPLVKRQKATDKALRKSQKMLTAIADQPDTSQAPFRGAGTAPAYKTSAMPAAPQTAAEAAAQAQTGLIQRLNYDWRNSPDPQIREAAYLEMTAQLGLNPMTGNNDPMNPFTR